METPRAAFSLIEIMVAVAILSVIILGLLAMFYQTERAWRAGVTQVDVMENGRAAVDIISRDLQELTVAGLPNVRNFLAAMDASAATPIYQALPNGRERTNVLQEFFFLTRANDQWKGVRYSFANLPSGVGTLYRMETNLPPPLFVHITNFTTILMNTAVDTNAPGDFHRVADGIIHLQLTAFDRAGLPFPNESLNNLTVMNQFFYTNAPFSLELELGVVEPRTYARFKILGEASLANARDFLAQRANRVHILRERIPIRTSP